MKREERSGNDYWAFRSSQLKKDIERDIEMYALNKGYNFAFETTGANIGQGWIDWIKSVINKFKEVNLVVIKADKKEVWRRVLLRDQEHNDYQTWSKNWDKIYGQNIPFLRSKIDFEEVTIYDNSGAMGEEKIVEHVRHHKLGSARAPEMLW